MASVKGRILWSLDQYDAELVEFDLQRWHVVIQEAVDMCKPLLVSRPPLPPMYGKACHMNRNVGFFADASETKGYSFSKQLFEPIPPPRALQALLILVNTHFGAKFNGVLVNEYINGSDYISAHSDNEQGLDSSVGVLSISFGTERTFRLRLKSESNRPIVYDATTKSCFALLMKGSDFQNMLTHEIPPTKRVTCRRVSFTFRHHNM